MQLADRTPIIAKGVFLSAVSTIVFFRTTRLASGFRYTIKSTRRILDAAGAMVLLEITYLLAFCPAAEAAALRGGGAGKGPKGNPAARHRVPGERWPGPPSEPSFVKKFLSFSCLFLHKYLIKYHSTSLRTKLHICRYKHNSDRQ